MNLRACIKMLALFCAALTAAVHAQTFPTRPMRVVVPLAAGGGMDSVSRNIAVSFAEALGQSVVVDNRPGAGGNVGAEIVARSAPDGYTLLDGTNGTHSINQALYGNLGFDPVKAGSIRRGSGTPRSPKTMPTMR